MVARAAAPKMTRVLWCPVRPNGWELIISSDGSSLLRDSDSARIGNRLWSRFPVSMAGSDRRDTPALPGRAVTAQRATHATERREGVVPLGWRCGISGRLPGTPSALVLGYSRVKPGLHLSGAVTAPIVNIRPALSRRKRPTASH